MRALLYIVFACVYVLSVAGVYGKIHFCCQKIQNIALYQDNVDPCCPEDKPNHEGSLSYFSASCCKTKALQYHQEDAHLLTPIFILNNLIGLLCNDWFMPEAMIADFSLQARAPNNHSYPEPVPRYISLCQLVFYQ